VGDWRVSKPAAKTQKKQKKKGGKKQSSSAKAVKRPADLLNSREDAVCLHCTFLPPHL